MERKAEKKKKKNLTLKRKLQIIEDLEKNKPESKRSLARKYEVTEAAIRYIWKNKDSIKSRASTMSQKMQDSLSKTHHAKYPELENKLFDCIDVCRAANQTVSPSLIIKKAKNIAEEMGLADFKAS